MGDILTVEKLLKTYDGFVLNEVSFTVPKGCIMGLIGENGAGKTTIIKLILNLIKREQGTINVFGLNNLRHEKEIKERLGVVLDEINFYQDLSAKDIATIMASIYKNWDNHLFFDYLQRFNIPERKIIKDLSKGMKMKLSIVTALSHNPEFLILDEPTGGLDPVARNEILDLLQEFIQDEKKSVLFSTHIVADLDKIADYITFVHKGEIILSEEKEKIFDDYGIIKCGKEEFADISTTDIVGYRENKFGYEVLIADKQEARIKYKDLIMDTVNLEELMLFYIGREKNERANH